MYFFFFNATTTTEIYTLSLHDALPICCRKRNYRRGNATVFVFGGQMPVSFRWVASRRGAPRARGIMVRDRVGTRPDRKSTRLNSSHSSISYAVFCLKKKTSKS